MNRHYITSNALCPSSSILNLCVSLPGPSKLLRQSGSYLTSLAPQIISHSDLPSRLFHFSLCVRRLRRFVSIVHPTTALSCEILVAILCSILYFIIAHIGECQPRPSRSSPTHSLSFIRYVNVHFGSSDPRSWQHLCYPAIHSIFNAKCPLGAGVPRKNVFNVMVSQASKCHHVRLPRRVSHPTTIIDLPPQSSWRHSPRLPMIPFLILCAGIVAVVLPALSYIFFGHIGEFQPRPGRSSLTLGLSLIRHVDI